MFCRDVPKWDPASGHTVVPLEGHESLATRVPKRSGIGCDAWYEVADRRTVCFHAQASACVIVSSVCIRPGQWLVVTSQSYVIFACCRYMVPFVGSPSGLALPAQLGHLVATAPQGEGGCGKFLSLVP